MLLEVLFAPEISLRGEDRRVSQEELDLFDFAARSMAQLRTSPTQIVWSDLIQLCSFGTPPNDVPDDVLGNAFTPRRSVSADGPEDPALANLGRHYPAIDRLLNPQGHAHRSHTAALSDQVDNSPVSLPDLHVFHVQG